MLQNTTNMKKVSKDFSSMLSINLTFSNALQEITLNKAVNKYRYCIFKEQTDQTGIYFSSNLFISPS